MPGSGSSAPVAAARVRSRAWDAARRAARLFGQLPVFASTPSPEPARCWGRRLADGWDIQHIMGGH
jgi:hypothetical protein